MGQTVELIIYEQSMEYGESVSSLVIDKEEGILESFLFFSLHSLTGSLITKT